MTVRVRMLCACMCHKTASLFAVSVMTVFAAGFAQMPLYASSYADFCPDIIYCTCGLLSAPLCTLFPGCCSQNMVCIHVCELKLSVFKLSLCQDPPQLFKCSHSKSEDDEICVRHQYILVLYLSFSGISGAERDGAFNELVYVVGLLQALLT